MTTQPEPKQESADWVAICLQFLFGAVFGSGIIFYEILRTGFGRDVGIHFPVICAMAGGFVLGAIAALFGDGVWGISFRVIPNMAIRHSRKSRLFFIFTMIISSLSPMLYWFLVRKG